MALDGAERRKQRIDALSDKIREHGSAGIPLIKALAWAVRSQGIRPETAREHLRILEESHEVVRDKRTDRLCHIETVGKTS